MTFATAAGQLYGLPPQEFTAARDARVSEARQAGDKDLASSLKQLRKPSAGAWMANMLVREQAPDIERLIKLGETLRSARNLDGERIRRASKEKQDTVTKLLRLARSLAKRAGQPVSQAAEEDLEATLDAAFADPQSAASLCEGRLTGALRYSGLGLPTESQGVAGSAPAGRARAGGGKGGSTSGGASRAKRALEQARREAERADADAEKAQRAVTAAEAEVQRMRATLTVALRQAKKAHANVSAAQKKL